MRSVIVTGGSREDVADAVKFLLSHEVKSITGTVMAEDAGSTV
jgi:enoyl-[acyl-carrier-protein] reductase (NADH)